jgi:hypothetical protein
MPQAIGVAVADYFAFNVIGATVATAAAVQTAVTLVATVAINQVAGRVLASSSGSGGTAGPQTLSTTVRQSDASRRLIYGTTKTGGVLLYPQQDPSGGNVRQVLYLGEGPISAVSSVFWVGDELSSLGKFAGLLAIESRLGTPAQTAFASVVAASGGEWTVDDRITGCAAVAVRMAASRDAFPRGRVNMPLAFMVDGRVCFDPRTGLSAFTRNPALCRLDYMRSEFGPDGGIADELIDFASFAAAANVCDEIIESIDPANVVDGVPGRVRRYTLDGVFEVSAGHTAICETMDRAMAGRVVFVGGQYRCYAGAWRAPTGPAITSDCLRAPVGFRTHQARTQRMNIARGTYRDPAQNWQSTDIHEQRLEQAVIDEDGEIVQALDFPATTVGATAQRLARLAMLQARSAVPLQLQCNWAAIQWQLYDVVPVNIPEAGVSGNWLITSYLLAEGGGVDMTLIPHLATDFEWTPAEHERTVVPVLRPNFNTVALGVTGLVVLGGGLIEVDEFITSYGLTATWDASADVYLKHYQAQYKRSDSADWLDGGVVRRVGFGSSGERWTRPLSTGFEYDVRVRIEREDGSVGPWETETNILVNGDTDPPGVPTVLSVTGTGTHTIGWTNPVSLDVMRARVYASLTNNPATATEVAEVFGLPATAYTTTHTPAGVPQYYWVEAVDRSGNPSARTAAGVGN